MGWSRILVRLPSGFCSLVTPEIKVCFLFPLTNLMITLPFFLGALGVGLTGIGRSAVGGGGAGLLGAGSSGGDGGGVSGNTVGETLGLVGGDGSGLAGLSCITMGARGGDTHRGLEVEGSLVAESKSRLLFIFLGLMSST